MRYASLRRGLVGAWCPSVSGPFGYRLPDLSGYGNHGTLTNMDPGSDWVVSGGKGALDFDGSNDTVLIDGSIVYVQSGMPFTASVHSYVRNITNLYTKFLMLKSDCAGNNAWEFGVSSDSLYLGILIGTASSYARVKTDTSNAIITNGWHHYAVVYNGADRSQSSSFRIYFDTTLQTNSSAHTFGSTTNATSISRNANLNRLDGVIDDIRIYNRALNEQEIRLLASERGIGLKPERQRNRYSAPALPSRNRSSRFLGFPS